MQDPSAVPTDDDARRPAGVVVGGLGDSQSTAGRPAGNDHVSRPGSRALKVPLWMGLVAAVLTGVAIAVLGSALHSQPLTLAGISLPVGALAALLLAGSGAVCVGLWARNVYLTTVVGAVAYLLVGLVAAGTDPPLVLTDLSIEPPLTAAMAGSIWVYGLAVVTIVATVVSWWILRPRRVASAR